MPQHRPSTRWRATGGAELAHAQVPEVWSSSRVPGTVLAMHCFTFGPERAGGRDASPGLP